MDMKDIIIIGASGYGGFLVIGVVCLIWYNIWNRNKMERERVAEEGILGRLEKAGAQSDTSLFTGSWFSRSSFSGSSCTRRSQESRASSTPSLSESAINDVYQGRRQSSQSISNIQNPRVDDNHRQQNSGQTMPPLVEHNDENRIGLALGGEAPNRGQRRRSVDSRDSWEL